MVQRARAIGLRLCPVRRCYALSNGCANGASGLSPQNRAYMRRSRAPVPVPGYLSSGATARIGQGDNWSWATLAGGSLREPPDWERFGFALGLLRLPRWSWLNQRLLVPGIRLFRCQPGLGHRRLDGRTRTVRLTYLVPPRCCLRRAWRIAGLLGGRGSAAKPTPPARPSSASRAEAHGCSSLPCKSDP